MRSWKLIVFLGLVLATTALFLRSQPQAIVVQRSLTLSANPTSIPAGQSASVTFTAQLRGMTARSVELLRANTAGTLSQAGIFQATGNGAYTLQIPVGQPAAGTISFAARALTSVAPPVKRPLPVRVAVPPTARANNAGANNSAPVTIAAMAANPELTSNTVLIAVVQAPPPPSVSIQNPTLVPTGVVQGQTASITVHASISTTIPLTVILRRADTGAQLATLTAPQNLSAIVAVFTRSSSYSGTFTLTPTSPGVIPLQIVATSNQLPAPVVAPLTLSVAPAAQTGNGNPTNLAGQNFSRFGISLAVPAGFRVNSDVYNGGGPIALDNFGSNYGQSPDGRFCCGGVIPMNGAAIDITMASTNGNQVSSIAQTELTGAENTAFDQIQIAGMAAVRARYDDSYPSLRFSNIAVYVGQGNLVYKFFLTYRAGDGRATDFASAFQSLLNSVQFNKEQ